MTKKLMIAFFVLALAVASAAGSYSVTLFQPTVVAGKELKPGEYKLTVDSTKVVLMRGKEKVEATVTTETGDSKFPSTSVRYATADGKSTLREIRLGGTKTRLVFSN